MFRNRILSAAFVSLCCLLGIADARAMERVLLSNGFAVDCTHREATTEGRERLYFDKSAANYVEIDSARIVGTEPVATEPIPTDPVRSTSLPAANGTAAGEFVAKSTSLSEASLHTLIANAGTAHNVNVALLESVVQAESGGHAKAVSRAGAQGLMQLMPGTARSLGVTDRFAPEQNLGGGTTYLDALLKRYHDNIALALAAYNAGPGAVDRYHGVPPYRETQVYVARIIREFNRRTVLQKKAALGSTALGSTALGSTAPGSAGLGSTGLGSTGLGSAELEPAGSGSAAQAGFR